MKRAIRLLLGLFLFAALFFLVDLQALLAAFYQLDLLSIFYLLILSMLLIAVSCIKWRLFIRVSGHDASLAELMRLYIIGYFFNIFMPSFVGGDVVRSIILGNRLSDQAQALLATFLERFTGLLAMAILGFVFVLLGSKATAGVGLLVLIVTMSIFALTALCFLPRLSQRLFNLGLHLLRLVHLNRLVTKAQSLYERMEASMKLIRTDSRLLSKAMFLSFIYQVLTVVNTYVAAVAIGWHPADVGSLFVVIPLVLLVTMIPVTPSGLGLQEGAFVFFLSRIGATPAEGLAVALILRAKSILFALIGGLLWLPLQSAKSAGSKGDKETAKQLSP